MSKQATKERLKYNFYKSNMNDDTSSKTSFDNDNMGESNNNDEDEDEDGFVRYQELNPEQLRISEWLDKVRFRKQLVGGVNEYDVWKKIIELNSMYEDALKAERLRCDILIDHYKNIHMLKEVDSEREGSK